MLSRITGGAWLSGTEALRIDRDDPMAEGFALSGTWGPQVGELGCAGQRPARQLS